MYIFISNKCFAEWAANHSASQRPPFQGYHPWFLGCLKLVAKRISCAKSDVPMWKELKHHLPRRDSGSQLRIIGNIASLIFTDIHPSRKYIGMENLRGWCFGIFGGENSWFFDFQLVLMWDVHRCPSYVSSNGSGKEVIPSCCSMMFRMVKPYPQQSPR